MTRVVPIRHGRHKAGHDGWMILGPANMRRPDERAATA